MVQVLSLLISTTMTGELLKYICREVHSVEARMRKVELENVYSMRRRIIEGTTTEPGVPFFWLHAMINSKILRKIIQVRYFQHYRNSFLNASKNSWHG